MATIRTFIAATIIPLAMTTAHTTITAMSFEFEIAIDESSIKKMAKKPPKNGTTKHYPLLLAHESAIGIWQEQHALFSNYIRSSMYSLDVE
jgi:hypothetical protein